MLFFEIHKQMCLPDVPDFFLLGTKLEITILFLTEVESTTFENFLPLTTDVSITCPLTFTKMWGI